MVLARYICPGVGVLNCFPQGGGEFAHPKNCPGGGGMVRLGID